MLTRLSLVPSSPDDGAAYAAEVSGLVSDLELYLLGRMAEHLGRPDPDDEAWERLALLALQTWRIEADRAVRGAEARLLIAITEALLLARDAGTATARIDLQVLGTTPAEVRPPTVVRRRAAQVASRLYATLRRVPRLLEQTYRDAVAAGVREVLGGQVTRLAATQHVLDRLTVLGVRGFRDKAGRNWSLTSYTEMAVRTEAGHQAVQGHMDALLDAGIELVVVSDSPRECPKCRPWEGRVLSLTGQVGTMIVPSVTGGRGVRVDVAGTLNQARRDGLQHPNCRHSISAYLPGATDLREAQSDPAGYAAGQRQRALERQVREWKRREALALDPAARARAAAKVRALQGQLRDHVARHDLKRLRRREQIDLAT